MRAATIAPVSVHRLMIVDDSNVIRRRIERAHDLPFVEFVGAARNGREALDLLAAEPCDVIVLDLMMPVMDGAEFKREADRRGITTPVLLVSAGHDTARQARELGAAGHLVKPVDPDDLEAAIARLAH